MSFIINPQDMPFVRVSTENHVGLDVALFANKLITDWRVDVTGYRVNDRVITIRWPTAPEERARYRKAFDYYDHPDGYPDLEFDPCELPEGGSNKPDTRPQKNGDVLIGGGKPPNVIVV
jgi:hypothetical protein